MFLIRNYGNVGNYKESRIRVGLEIQLHGRHLISVHQVPWRVLLFVFV